MTKRAHVWISGVVQGVNFRWYMAEQARLHGVGGWVRNTRDGRVEAVLEGDEASVQAVVDWCHIGPPHASVSRVKVDEEEPEGLGEFELRW